MNILLIGSGGREHALAWKLAQSPSCDRLFIAPGNAGTAKSGTNVAIAATDLPALASFCISGKIDMVVVGPEDPLVKGIYDFFKADATTTHIHVIGPSMQAARLEGSKVYAKAFMQRYGIPTAGYRDFDAFSFEEGIEYIKKQSLPIVLKADGLAAGKGVVICSNYIEALSEFELMIQQAKFGEAGKRVVIEQFLDGIEVSMFVLTDGKHYVLLPDAKDYKRVGSGNTGPNTGGMGAVSPVPFVDEGFRQKVVSTVVEPTIRGIISEQLEYKGVIFLGLINVGGEPFVIEYNCRFGDPETEVIIPRLENDLAALFLATAEQRLDQITIKTIDQAAVTVVAVSGGYPNQYETGKVIFGLDLIGMGDTLVFHAGTKEERDKVLTNGGRVLAVTSFGESIAEAAEKSNSAVEQIFFDGIYSRDDIGFEFR